MANNADKTEEYNAEDKKKRQTNRFIDDTQLISKLFKRRKTH